MLTKAVEVLVVRVFFLVEVAFHQDEISVRPGSSAQAVLLDVFLAFYVSLIFLKGVADV